MMFFVALAVLLFLFLIGFLAYRLKRPLFQYLFFIRAPFCLTLIFIGLPLLAIGPANSLLENLLVITRPAGILYITGAAYFVSLMLVQTTRLTVDLAPLRFKVHPLLPQSDPNKPSSQWPLPNAWRLIFVLLPLPLLLTTCWLSMVNTDDAWLLLMPPLGLFLTWLIIHLAYVAADYLDSFHSEWERRGERVINFLQPIYKLRSLDGGYFLIDAQGRRRLRHEHRNMAAITIIVTILYLIGFLWNPVGLKVPALFFVLVLITMSGYILGGTTFLVDRYRVPVLIVLFAASSLQYSLFEVAHFYELFQVQQSNAVRNVRAEQLGKSKLDVMELREDAVSEFQSSLEKRLHQQPAGRRTLVLFALSGGGIQAAGWSAQVLTGFHEQKGFGQEFVDAIGMISSVSGGSVGSLFFIDRIDALKAAKNKEQQEEVRKLILDAAMDNGLKSTAWGMAYPDFLRSVGLNLLLKYSGNQLLDRGRALEKSFQSHMQHQNSSMLGRWRTEILKGNLPIPVFNATFVETGDRFLISPMQFPVAEKAWSLRSYYPNFDIKTFTAARLSATFPYVTPTARPYFPGSPPLGSFPYHVADGGYFDNFGVFTVAEWLDRVILPDNQQKLKLDQVLIVQINAFPKALNAKKPASAWMAAVFGPALTLSSVRNSTQIARNHALLQALQERWAPEGIDIETFDIRFELRVANSSKEAPDRESHLKEYEPPLSWKLTQEQKMAIRDAWQVFLDGDEFKRLKIAWTARQQGAPTLPQPVPTRKE